MIKKLGKSISIIFFVFFSIIIVFASISFLYLYSKAEATKYKSFVREVVYEEDLSSFLDGDDIEDLNYCTFYREDKNSQFHLVNNFIPDLTDREATKLLKNLKMKKEVGKKDDFIKIRRENVIIFVSKEELNRDYLYIVIAVIVVDVFLFLGFFFITKLISKRIIKPIVENEKKEKKFVSNTSHELKTPLTIIKANIEMLEKEIGYNKRIEYINNETLRMTKLINNMMELNNVSSLSDKSKMSISNAVTSVSLPFESVVYDSGKKYELDIEDNIYINGNYSQIQSLVSILIDNAISYSYVDTTVTVQLCSKGNRCCLSVKNVGDEISKESKRLIFDRFYREDESRYEEGNHFGLGLAIASGIVDAHGAKISVNSENNVNTFSVVFKRI